MSYGPVVLPAGTSPLIRCQTSLTLPYLGTDDRVPFYGRVTDAGDDYLGFRHTATAVLTVAAATPLIVSMLALGASLTDVTPEQITAMGAAGGLTTEGTQVHITRLDTAGFVRLTQAAAVNPVGSSMPFDAKANETGTSGVTLTDGAVALAAGTYAITTIFSVDVFWG